MLAELQGVQVLLTFLGLLVLKEFLAEVLVPVSYKRQKYRRKYWMKAVFTQAAFHSAFFVVCIGPYLGFAAWKVLLTATLADYGYHVLRDLSIRKFRPKNPFSDGFLFSVKCEQLILFTISMLFATGLTYLKLA